MENRKYKQTYWPMTCLATGVVAISMTDCQLFGQGGVCLYLCMKN